MSRMFIPDDSMAGWLKSHGSKQLFTSSCVANVLMHMALHEYNKATYIPPGTLAELQVVVEMDIYNQIVDLETYLADPVKLLGFASENLGNTTILEATEKHESTTALFDYIKSIASPSLPIAPMTPPKGNQCYLAIKDNHATLVYNDGDRLMSYDPGKSASPGMGLIMPKKIGDINGLTALIELNPRKFRHYVDSVHAAFAENSADFLEKRFTSLELKHDLYSHLFTHRLITLFSESAGRISVTNYLVHGYMQRNLVLKMYYRDITESLGPDGKTSDQLIAKGPVNLDELDIPPFTTDDPHEIAKADYLGYIIIMHHVNPIEARRVITEQLAQAREGSFHPNNIFQNASFYAPELMRTLPDEYNDIKDEIREYIFTEGVFPQLSDTIHKLDRLSSLATNDEQREVVKQRLESMLEPASMEKLITLPGELHVFIRISNKTMNQPDKIELISAVLNSEVGARLIASINPEDHEWHDVSNTASLLESIDPALAETYSSHIKTTTEISAEAETKSEPRAPGH
ncbi:MAG: hypothetical protein P1U63_06105 [Coxiellaceae bacterium]|nr:hypothetical protein [Coxiellaceae bacterium]